jgi:hypothetical protein
MYKIEASANLYRISLFSTYISTNIFLLIEYYWWKKISSNQEIYSTNNSYKENHKELFYLSNYRYGGGTTFTAHLLHTLSLKHILCLTDAFKNNVGKFGYGITYYKKSVEFLRELKHIFIANMYKNFHLLDKLKDKDITIVIHDPGELYKDNEPYIKNWAVIVIRKSVQNYLKNKYGIDATFLYHPFYPYQKHFSKSDDNKVNDRCLSVSISRIDYYKNIDVILKANKGLHNPVRIFGLQNHEYIASQLNGLKFEDYYHGLFNKSFNQVSKILCKSKFMVDLSELPNDGGGTQYTFLEAIYNDAAIILNRKWIENVERCYCDFKEGYNCLAVSNERDLRELIKNYRNTDTAKVTKNAKKLLSRHVNTTNDWSRVVL